MIGNLILRLVVIAFGLLLAMFAAGIFISIGMFSGWFRDFLMEVHGPYGGPDDGTVAAFFIGAVGIFTSFQVMAAAFLPSAIAIAIAELMRWTGLTINLVLGGLVALFTGVTMFAFPGRGPHGDPYAAEQAVAGLPSEGTLIVLLATGFVAAFVYWLIAGRSAGKWMDRPAAVAK